MNQIVFSSTDGGQAHRDLIRAQLFDLHSMAKSSDEPIDIEIMAFAFTDTEIAAELANLVERCANVQVRIIADWSQGAPKNPSVVPALARSSARISLKYKIDLPYFADKTSGRIKWGYHTSHGMLHHKTMLVRRAGEAIRLVLGSFNWGNRGTKSYENTMLLERDAATGPVLDAFHAEFCALWSDKCMTLGPGAARKLALAARMKVQAGGSMHDLEDLYELLGQRAAHEQVLEPQAARLATGSIIPAFSGRRLTSMKAHYGFSPQNHSRKLDLTRPSGARRAAPVSVNSVALEAIRSAGDGAAIKVAMYAMSPRVPEFGALLEAARRGCPVHVLLDRKIGKGLAHDLAEKAGRENLPIEVRATNRRMHQKYILTPDNDTVVTGTANMTADSASRHAEHRILFREAAELAQRFNQDFETIWSRVG